MNNIKISIITVTYNSEKTVRTTFESIRAQRYLNLEYIVVDGGSNDSTLEIAREYDDVISKMISEPDRGISDAMNKGISLATGELIGIIHSDDALEDNALNLLSEMWDGQTDVYYGNVVVMSSDWNRLHILRPAKNLSEMNYSLSIIHPSSFVTKKAYETFGDYDLELKCCMDYDLFLRFYKNGAKFKYISSNLALYRLGGTNQQYRKQTINESCLVSIRYGGNKCRAYYIKYKKIVKDMLRPIASKLGIHNKRVSEDIDGR